MEQASKPVINLLLLHIPVAPVCSHEETTTPFKMMPSLDPKAETHCVLMRTTVVLVLGAQTSLPLIMVP